MDVLSQDQYKELLSFLPTIRSSFHEWLLIDIRLIEVSNQDFTIGTVVKLIQTLFHDNTGKIYMGGTHEILVLLRWRGLPVASAAETIKAHLPEGKCEVEVVESTKEGLARLEMKIIQRKTPTVPSLADLRAERRKNVVLVVDDDMYQRALIRSGLAKIATIVEIDNGDNAEIAYRECNPDVVLLDIHMPGRSGRDIVYLLSELDPDSYIVMVSADGSQVNIADTWQKGAREFLTKPFTKERLITCVTQCPTFTTP